MALSPNARLGRYEIRSLLGEGGMGEVYLARDPKIGRDVAIKVLPAQFSADAERLARFEQEACAAGALNHPNVLAVHDVGQHDGAPFVVSELLEGETLREKLRGAPLPQRKAVEYASQIARGLAAAHERGIVHRDLKPENIFITSDGRAKILDFGLAKLTQGDGRQSQTEIPTWRVDTGPGAVMGTVGYMAPEQVRGRRVDHRADIFSFGAVLYEMLTGRRAFRGESAADALSAVLREDPPALSESNRNVSPALERLVLHCLEKDPAARFHSASDLAFALESLSGATAVSGEQTPTMHAPAGRGVRRRELIAWGVAGAALVAASLALILPSLRRAPQEATAAAARFLIAPPGKGQVIGAPLISPDGRRVILVVRDTAGRQSLWLRPLDSLDAQQLAGTEAGDQPFWSPDGRSIGFIAAGKLKRLDVSGGPTQTLSDAVGVGGAWNRDGVIVFSRSPTEGLYRIPAAGGTPEPLTTLDKSRDEYVHAWPHFLPDGRHFLYVAGTSPPEKSAVFLGSLDSKQTRLLIDVGSSVSYAPPGYLLYAREGTLVARPFDADRLELTGEAVPVVKQIGVTLGNARAHFSVSETGTLIYRPSAAEADTQLVWFDRTGKQLGTVGAAGHYSDIRLSPDGKRLAFRRLDTENGASDIWLMELTRGAPTRLTFDPADDGDAVWSPDGGRVVFSSQREGLPNLYQKLSSGAGGEELILKTEDAKWATDWSPDGRHVLYATQGRQSNDLWVLPLFGERRPEPFARTDFSEGGGRFSPDGRWIAYTSNESGRFEVYVQSFPASGGKWQVSNGGGGSPRWRRDGRELFYLSADGKLMVVEVDGSSDTFKAGVPGPLFEPRVGAISGDSPYDAAADGRRFLIKVPVEETAPAPVTVVLNWTTDLKR
ncbi:MAG TPA: protein kinase [Pyrinomonadaceae bacterium]|nr:protein kinase [Pyrinomonadaceae bacterium]